ncbi:MAG TPA: AMP-binding protein, partial [Ignavibacteriaceae bacterium]|nr:AMP-binding protein [Ignavibacteriaceae bacterium]
MKLFEELILPNHSLSPDSIALVEQNFKINYSELQENALNYASYLSESGIRSNEYIPILSDNNKEFVYLVLALWTIGAVPVPLNTRLTQNEINKLFVITGSKYIVIQNDIRKNYQFDNSVSQIVFPFELSNPGEIPIQKDNFDKDKTAVVIFTSGSTGSPKGVELSFNNLFKNAQIGNQVLGQGNDKKWLASLPFYHIGGFSIITRALRYGAGLIIPNSLKIDDLAYAIKNQKPTFASFVSTQLKRLIENNIAPNPELKTVLLGGGFIDPKLLEEAFENGWKITIVYGSSETSSFVTANKIESLQSKLDSVGKALSPNEIKIVDSDGKSLPANSSGELIVKSEAVMKGYINNSEE